MASKFKINGLPIDGNKTFTENDFLLGSDEDQTPAVFPYSELMRAVKDKLKDDQDALTPIGALQDGDLVMGVRNGENVLYTYEAIIGAKPKGLAITNVTATDEGESVEVKFTLTSREGLAMQYRVKYIGGEFNDWSPATVAGQEHSATYLVIPVPTGPRTIEIEAKDAFVTEPVSYKINVNVTTAGNGDVTVTMNAADGIETSHVTATITDDSGDQVYWRGKHDLTGFTDWRGPYPSPHSMIWDPYVPGGVRVMTVEGKSVDAPPYATDSRTVTITEAPLLPGDFKLLDANATHDRNVAFTKTIRLHASADSTQVKLIARKHTGEWIYNGAWFMAQGEHRIVIPVTLGSDLLTTENTQVGTKYFWKVVMEGGSKEYEFGISSVAPPAFPPVMTGYGAPDKDWNFGTGGTVTNAAQLDNEFDWGMYWGVDDQHHQKNNDTEWGLFTEFTSPNYRFDATHLALVPINTVAPNTPVQDDITTGSIRSRHTINGADATKSYFIEAKIDLPRGKGFWPAFWLFPTPGDKGKSEIDIFEFVGTANEMNENRELTDLHTNLHTHGANSPYQGHVQFGSTVQGLDPSPSNGFHIYALEIDGPSQQLRYYYDNVLIRESSFNWSGGSGTGWVPAGPAEVIINLSTGGGWPGPSDNPADFDSLGEMLIDYLKIWSKTG